MTQADVLVAGIIALVAVVAALRLQIYRLRKVLTTRTDLLLELLGAATRALTTEEVSAARATAEQAIQRLDERGLGERLDQEERRA